jgi:hypothetical protein
MPPFPADLQHIPLVPLEKPPTMVIKLPLRDYNRLQLCIIFGDDHKWLAGVDLQHDPTIKQNELIEHWIGCGAAKRFSQHYQIQEEPVSVPASNTS